MILFGTNPIAWSNDDDRTIGAHISLDQCLDDCRAIGFDGIERGHKLPTTPEGLKQVLGSRGHCTFGGGDPLAVARRHMGRVAHIHAKNIRPAVMAEVRAKHLPFLESVRRGVFTVPGDPEGCVEFTPVLKVATEHGYQGWLVIEAEQDPLVRDPLKYQMMGLACLKHFAAQAGRS